MCDLLVIVWGGRIQTSKQLIGNSLWRFKKEEERGSCRTKMAFNLPMAHVLSLWSSPPMIGTLGDFYPIFKYFTFDVCATNSSSKPCLI